MHRDLKLENIFITKQMTIKVSDFALAREMEMQDGWYTRRHSFCGTKEYMAPEMINSTLFNGHSF